MLSSKLRSPEQMALRPAWLPETDSLRRHYADTVLYPRYRLELTEGIARLLPSNGPCTVLDVGAGDGYLGSVLQSFRPQTRVLGVETYIRRRIDHALPLIKFDGVNLPFADRSFDVSLLSNVLHHAREQGRLFREVCRVTRNRVIIKDHLATGRLDRFKLAVLDVLGNARFGASTIGTYLDEAQWAELFAQVPNARVTRYDHLQFRTGLLETIFRNQLEVMFLLSFE